LPGDQPVAWREVTKKTLGKFNYLLRILLLIEIPVILYSVLFAINAAGYTWRREAEEMTALVFILWVIAVAAVSIKSSSTIVSERSNQTLDVLLTTPLSGTQIIKQKMRGVYRLIVVFMIPLLTAVIVEALWESHIYEGYGYRSEFTPAFYLIVSFLAIFIYLPMFSWVSLWVGLKVRSKSRAIVVTLIVITAWISAPFLIIGLVYSLVSFYREASLNFFLLFSPVTITAVTETGEINFIGGSLVVPTIYNFLWHGGILLYFRWLCLRKADRYLGRL
jgi:hypothetical protein